ncbi:hypothetical protein F5Y18DRAFT_19113 [Xylariaceae sp. FL1019]|nr:hypothetical protein F5Y18DRAFT_19113 [Xylariaceae sp. FL1019]
MGLPLFIAPVESDIPSKPAAKSPVDPAHGRTPIRRYERRRTVRDVTRDVREHRLRMLATLEPDNALLDGHPTTRNDASRSSSSSARARFEARRASRLREQAEQARLDDIADREMARALLRGEDSDEDAPTAHERQIAESRALRVQAAARQRTIETSLHRGGARSRPSSLLSPHPHIHPSGYTAYRPSRRDDGLFADGNNDTDWRRPADLLRAARVRYVDGLGDRDRSLSPDADGGAWDTLQSTLTPDPQPPSVGSSFASTNASAAASQSAEATSLNTSITDTEPPCDPVADNDESDADDAPAPRFMRDDLRPSRHPSDNADRSLFSRSTSAPRPRTESSRPSPPYGTRSYADVAADLQEEMQSRQTPEAPDVSGTAAEAERWLSGMHRIISGLASSRDIPDEWWTQAGLSRSMSWEEEVPEGMQ